MKKLCALFLLVAFSMHLAHFTVCANEIRHGNAETRRIALTFDDGPHPYQTDKILALLEKYGIHATFFVVGENISYYTDVFRREVAAGHEIGNHTYHHTIFASCTESQIKEELDTTADLIEEITGKRPTLFRPPEGNCTSIETAASKGYRVILWSVDTRDWAKTPTDEIVQHVENSIKGGSILLFHDYTAKDAHTLESLEILIPRLLAKGYEFVTVSELIDGE